MKKFAEEPNLLGLGLSRRWEGAVMGILLVLLVSLLYWGTDFSPFAAGFLFPGYLVAILLKLSVKSDLLAVLTLFGISSIPAAMIGSLVISRKSIQRTIGIILLVTYVALWIFSSLFFIIMSD